MIRSTTVHPATRRCRIAAAAVAALGEQQMTIR